jgi:hypothetical protein
VAYVTQSREKPTNANAVGLTAQFELKVELALDVGLVLKMGFQSGCKLKFLL